MDTHRYNISLTWEEGRRGVMNSSELLPQIEVATPPEFAGGIAGIWSPEHLFVAAVSSCLMTTFLAIAENSAFEFTSFSCQAIGKLEKVEGKLMMSEILLKPTVIIHDEQYREKAIRIVNKAEKACLISNSITSKITMEIDIQVVGVNMSKGI